MLAGLRKITQNLPPYFGPQAGPPRYAAVARIAVSASRVKVIVRGAFESRLATSTQKAQAAAAACTGPASAPTTVTGMCPAGQSALCHLRPYRAYFAAQTSTRTLRLLGVRSCLPVSGHRGAKFKLGRPCTAAVDRPGHWQLQLEVQVQVASGNFKFRTTSSGRPVQN